MRIFELACTAHANVIHQKNYFKKQTQTELSKLSNDVCGVSEATGVRQSERKSESGGSTHAPEAGVGSGADSSSTRSSSSGSDKTPSHPNYDSTAMQQVELHTYKNLPIKSE